MKSVNKVMGLGNVGSIRYKDWFDGTGSLSFGLALNESWKDRDGKEREHTEWLNCVVGGKRGAALQRFITKGMRLYVEGPLRTQEGSDGKRYTEVMVRELIILGEPKGSGGPPLAPPAASGDAVAEEDDVPF